MKVSGAVVVALAGFAGALVPSAPLPVLISASCIVALLTRCVRAATLLAALVFALFGWYRASSHAADYEEARRGARDALGSPRRCAGRGVVVTSPSRRGERLGFVIEAHGLDCEGRILRGPLKLRLYGGPADLARGDTVEVVGQLAPVRLFRNAELPDPVPFAARQGAVLSGASLSVERVRRGSGTGSTVDRLRAHARARIDATFSPRAAPMARALVLGENDLDTDDDEAFRHSGLSHLLAVSGTHLVFAVVLLVRGLAFLLVRIERLAAAIDVGRLAGAFGAFAAPLYADFAGGSGSAWRAAWMLSGAFLVRALGRRPSVGNSFAASLTIGCLSDPMAAFDLSFLLSAAATAGLVVLGQPMSHRMRALPGRVLRFSALAVTATVASMIPCTPLLARLSPTITIAGIAANVFAAPFGEVVALPICLLHPLMTWAPELERGLALVGSGALLVVREVAHASARTTWLQVPVPFPSAWHFSVLAVGSVGAWLAGGSARRLFPWALATAAALGIVEIGTIYMNRTPGGLRATALDVGQGDATFVDFPDGSSLLVDAGGFVGSPVDPGDRVVAPLLRVRRRSQIDIVALSHPHPDHFGGLLSALEDVRIAEFWDTGQGSAEGAGPSYAALLSSLRKRGVPIRRPKELCGRERSIGGASLRVLAPCPDFEPHINANDNSFVFQITLGARSILLVGDAEEAEERRLLSAYGGALKSDLLKVGHHGSRTSTTLPFLAMVRPSVATISCGVRNRFGHPHETTLESLRTAGVRTFRLDRSGSVDWWTDGRRVRLKVVSPAQL